MKILLLSRYDRLGASSRVRSYQYTSYLEAEGFKVTAQPLLGARYLQKFYSGGRKPMRELVIAYLRRLGYLLNSRDYDLLWIEYELLPWLPPWCEMILTACGIPYVVDYDDAVFHRYDMHRNYFIKFSLGRKVDTIMRRAAVVMVGNDYLAARAREAGASRIEHFPTVVDLDKYKLSRRMEPDERVFVIGWIGTPITVLYLKQVESALQELSREGNLRIIIIGADYSELSDVPLEIRAWSEETEVADIQSFDVGIMPLPDEPWERGKCGYKVIQYMACGKPAVASPVGVNRKIIENGIDGFLPVTTEQWVGALRTLRDDPSLRESMGNRARIKVESAYSLQVTGPRLAALFHNVLSNSD